MKVRIISTVKEFREYAKNNGYRGYILPTEERGA